MYGTALTPEAAPASTRAWTVGGSASWPGTHVYWRTFSPYKGRRAAELRQSAWQAEGRVHARAKKQHDEASDGGGDDAAAYGLTMFSQRVGSQHQSSVQLAYVETAESEAA